MKIRFSLRSILIVMGSVAGLCALAFAPHPLSGVISDDLIVAGDLAVFCLCWTIAGASIGYDLAPRPKGWIVGAATALVLGVILTCLGGCAFSALDEFRHMGK